MSEEKDNKRRYTAQEMREIEQLINSDDSDKDLFVCNNTKSRFEMEHIFDYNEEATLKVKAMLRQAADTEELLEEKQVRLNEALRILDETREQRQIMLNRINAVLKDIPSDCLTCQFSKCDGSCKLSECAFDDILKAARGEGVDKK